MDLIIRDYIRVLKPGASLHIVLPDLKIQAEKYLHDLQDGRADAADIFIENSILSKRTRGTLRYRLLEFHGGYGLQHRWMYDRLSIVEKIKNYELEILEENNTPSKNYHYGDESIHIVVRKKN
jgi:hypothetical protein